MRLFVRTRTERGLHNHPIELGRRRRVSGIRKKSTRLAIIVSSAVKLPRVRIDVIIDPLRGERVLRSTKLQRKVKTFPGALTALARSKERNVDMPHRQFSSDNDNDLARQMPFDCLAMINCILKLTCGEQRHTQLWLELIDAFIFRISNNNTIAD